MEIYGIGEGDKSQSCINTEFVVQLLKGNRKVDFWTMVIENDVGADQTVIYVHF